MSSSREHEARVLRGGGAEGKMGREKKGRCCACRPRSIRVGLMQVRGLRMPLAP